MENASKALLMAAGVLMGILILSLGVYLYTNFSSSTTAMERQMELDEINNFNNKFLAYDGKTDLTIYDVYTVANLAAENNAKYELENEGITSANFYIEVDLTFGTTTTRNIEKENKKLNYNEFIKKYMEDRLENQKMVKRLVNFTCKVTVNENTGRVNKVEFKNN